MVDVHKRKKAGGPPPQSSPSVPAAKPSLGESTGGNTSYLGFIVVLTILSGVSIYVFRLVNKEQSDPYMDEIFHVPQTRKYCAGNYFEWDPKITTLPGTYLLASSFLSGVRVILPRTDVCTTSTLRSFNLVVSLANFCLIYYILGFYNKTASPLKRLVSAVNIATVPILYFFSFFFYTDATSTAFLLLMHACYLNKQFGFSALSGAYSVFTRQTNIVWVFYEGTNSILEILSAKYGEMIFLLPFEGKRFFMSWMSQSSRSTKVKRSAKGKKVVTRPRVSPESTNVWRTCGDQFIDHGIGYVLVGLAFLLFIFVNGSIVVGDKEAHQATLNVPQFLYFALVFGTFTISFMIARSRQVIQTLVQSPANILFLIGLFGIAIYFNSPAHPYLLADNRHYTFYVWKRFYENIPCLRYIWIPFYILVWTMITSAMGLDKVLVCNFIFCTVINLIPQLLLEFRYFIPAYLFARITFKNTTWFELLLEFIIHQGFNVLTIYLFLNKPFQWPDTPGLQRFMW